MIHTDFFRRGIPWVELLLESRNGSVRAQPGLAPPAQHACRTLRRSRHRSSSAAPGCCVARSARDSQPLLLLAPRTATRRARGRRRSRPSLASPPDGSGLRSGGGAAARRTPSRSPMSMRRRGRRARLGGARVPRAGADSASLRRSSSAAPTATRLSAPRGSGRPASVVRLVRRAPRTRPAGCVVIATPPQSHADLCMQCASRPGST